MTRVLLMVFITTFAGCDRPGDHPISPNCQWNETDHRTLNLANATDRRHLRFDAVTAEDMAIRWADQYAGHRPEWDERCQECMETLFIGLAKNHGVDVATVRHYSRERDVVLDAAVIVCFALMYAGVAYLFAGRIRQRFPPGEPGFWVMALTLSVGISLIGVLVGMFGSIIVEGLRMNSGHLSFRMNRIPFRAHSVVLFAGCVITFMLASLLHYYKKQDAPLDLLECGFPSITIDGGVRNRLRACPYVRAKSHLETNYSTHRGDSISYS